MCTTPIERLISFGFISLPVCFVRLDQKKSDDQQGFLGSIVTLEWLCELIELVAAGSNG